MYAARVKQREMINKRIYPEKTVAIIYSAVKFDVQLIYFVELIHYYKDEANCLFIQVL